MIQIRRWTTQPPTEEGWYAFRFTRRQIEAGLELAFGFRWLIVRVCRQGVVVYPNSPLYAVVPSTNGNEAGIKGRIPVELCGGEWAGPLVMEE